MKKIPTTHKLESLAQDLNMGFTPGQLKKFKKISSFFYHRYPDKASYDSISNILNEIKDEIFPGGIECLPGELGTDDWNKIYSIYEELIKLLPEELYEEYTYTGTKIGSLDPQ